MARIANIEKHTISAIILTLQQDLNMITLIKCTHSFVKRNVINLRFKTCKLKSVRVAIEFATGNETTIQRNKKA